MLPAIATTVARLRAAWSTKDALLPENIALPPCAACVQAVIVAVRAERKRGERLYLCG